MTRSSGHEETFSPISGSGRVSLLPFLFVRILQSTLTENSILKTWSSGHEEAFSEMSGSGMVSLLGSTTKAPMTKFPGDKIPRVKILRVNISQRQNPTGKNLPVTKSPKFYESQKLRMTQSPVQAPILGRHVGACATILGCMRYYNRLRALLY